MAGVLRRGASAQTVTTATDKRFRRAHVKPSRRRSPSAKHAWLAARLIALTAVVGYAAYHGVTLLAAASSLQIGQMVVRGHERLSTGEVLSLVEGLRGQNILAIKLDEWQTKLLASPWVESATIRRVLPATLEIAVRERRPIGLGRLNSHLYLIDGGGVIIDEYGPAYADIDLPIIDGLATSPQDGGALVDRARAEFASRVIAALAARPEIAKRVSQLDVGNLHDAVVILDGDRALLRLGESDFVARLQQYIDLAPALHQRLAGIDYVDLRFDERLYVRPPKALARARQ